MLETVKEEIMFYTGCLLLLDGFQYLVQVNIFSLILKEGHSYGVPSPDPGSLGKRSSYVRSVCGEILSGLAHGGPRFTVETRSRRTVGDGRNRIGSRHQKVSLSGVSHQVPGDSRVPENGPQVSRF